MADGGWWLGGGDDTCLRKTTRLPRKRPPSKMSTVPGVIDLRSFAVPVVEATGEVRGGHARVLTLWLAEPHGGPRAMAVHPGLNSALAMWVLEAD